MTVTDEARKERARLKALRNGHAAEASETAVIETLSDVIAERVHWLWWRRLPLGKLVMIGGDPGTSKSFLSLDLAARLSSGRPWPDGEVTGAPADIILLCGEDGLKDTIKPRLVALAAATERIHHFTALATDDGPRRPPSLSRASDLAWLEQTVAEHQARLVIIDPLTMYVSESSGKNPGAAARSVTTPLAALAERTGVCVLIVVHLNKVALNNALYRLSGAVDWVAATRVAFAVGLDPTDTTGQRKLLLPIKCNLSAPPEGLGYHVEDPGLVVWDQQPVTVNAAQMLGGAEQAGPGSRTQEAEEFLRQFLADGRKAANEIFAAANDIAGIKSRTLETAKRNLGVVSDRVMGQWYWILPGVESKTATPTPSAVYGLAALDVLDAEGANVSLGGVKTTTQKNVVIARAGEAADDPSQDRKAVHRRGVDSCGLTPPSATADPQAPF